MAENKRRHFGAMNGLVQMQADPIARAAIDAMKGQLLIVLVNRLGGAIDIPVAEIDGTGEFNLSMAIDENRNFHFQTGRKK